MCSVCVRAPLFASQIVVNLEPSQPELGVLIAPLPSMHGAKGCKCDRVSLADMRINHYLGSIGDFMDKTRRYWQVRRVVCACVCLTLLATNIVCCTPPEEAINHSWIWCDCCRSANDEHRGAQLVGQAWTRWDALPTLMVTVYCVK